MKILYFLLCVCVTFLENKNNLSAYLYVVDMLYEIYFCHITRALNNECLQNHKVRYSPRTFSSPPVIWGKGQRVSLKKNDNGWNDIGDSFFDGP